MRFLLLLQMLTRIPVKRSLPCEKEDFRKAAAWFPAVGLLLGLLSLAAYWLGAWLLGPVAGGIFCTLLLILATGALHNDGLADCFDAFFCFKDKEGMLLILKDSRMGAYGTLALVFDVLLRIFLVAMLPGAQAWFLLAVPVLGRSSEAMAAAIGKPARPGGSGALFIGNVGRGTAVFCAIIAFLAFAAVGWFTGGWAAALWAAGCALAGLAAAFGFYRLCDGKLGGLTGDCLGGCCETAELAALLALAIVFIKIL
jgi:adenosylcobinamide-GDP ribazoletransferase